MSDLISRQAAIDEANAWLLDCFKVQKQDRSCGLIRRLEDLPCVTEAEDVAPVVHAHWIHDFIDADWNCGVEIHCGWICSHCDGYAEMESKTKYCPFCGAKMDEEVETDE